MPRSAFRRCHSRSIRRGTIHLADMCLCRSVASSSLSLALRIHLYANDDRASPSHRRDYSHLVRHRLSSAPQAWDTTVHPGDHADRRHTRSSDAFLILWASRPWHACRMHVMDALSGMHTHVWGDTNASRYRPYSMNISKCYQLSSVYTVMGDKLSARHFVGDWVTSGHVTDFGWVPFGELGD